MISLWGVFRATLTRGSERSARLSSLAWIASVLHYASGDITTCVPFAAHRRGGGLFARRRFIRPIELSAMWRNSALWADGRWTCATIGASTCPRTATVRRRCRTKTSRNLLITSPLCAPFSIINRTLNYPKLSPERMAELRNYSLAIRYETLQEAAIRGSILSP